MPGLTEHEKSKESNFKNRSLWIRDRNTRKLEPALQVLLNNETWGKVSSNKSQGTREDIQKGTMLDTSGKATRQAVLTEIFQRNKNYDRFLLRKKRTKNNTPKEFKRDITRELRSVLKPTNAPDIRPVTADITLLPKKEKERTNLREVNLIELIVHVAESFTPYYEAVNQSLKINRKYGFAGHDIFHIVPTAVETLYHIERAKESGNKKITEDSALIAVIAALNHDLGNLLGRKEHNKPAPFLAKRISPWFYQNYPELIPEVNQGIRLHGHHRLLREIQKGRWGKTADKVIENLPKKLPPTTLALILADKLQRNRFRVEGDSLTTQAFDADPHTFLNFFFQTQPKGTGASIIEKDYPLETKASEKDWQFTWNIAFTPFLTPEEKISYPELVEHSSQNNGLAYIPQQIKERHRIEKKPYFELFQDKLWNISYDKLLCTAMVAFALYPPLKEFAFIFQSQKESHKIVLYRGQIQKGIDDILNKYQIQKSKETAII
jgi:hypothetical protein